MYKVNEGQSFFELIMQAFTLFSLQSPYLRLLSVALIAKKCQWRSSSPTMFCKKEVLRNFTKFTGKYQCQGLFLNNVTGLRPEACNYIKKETRAKVFSCEFCKISMNTFLYRTPLVAASVNGYSKRYFIIYCQWQLILVSGAWRLESFSAVFWMNVFLVHKSVVHFPVTIFYLFFREKVYFVNIYLKKYISSRSKKNKQEQHVTKCLF